MSDVETQQMSDGKSANERELSLDVVGQLLALLAHDLRNPLSAIHSNLGFLMSMFPSAGAQGRGNDNPSDELGEAVSDGLISCDGLTYIIDNIELFGQSLRDGPTPGRGDCELAALVSDVVVRCTPTADSYGVKLRFEVAGHDSQVVRVNREILGRALSNLVRNAIQHSIHGQTVRVLVEARASGATTPKFARVCVMDSGTPIEETDRDGLFTADGQVRAKGIAHGRYSRGLGLFVARLAAELTGASVFAETGKSQAKNTLVLEVPLA
jgi:two-component system, OmpR family, heavy metal sensor histidine kinase CusS